MFDYLRIKFLTCRMKRRIVTDDNYPEYKKDLEEILKRSSGRLPLFAYEYALDVIKERSDIPEHMKADIIVTIRDYMHKSPAYRLMKELEQIYRDENFE